MATVIGPDDYVDLPVRELVATMIALMQEFVDGKRINPHENWSILGAVRIRCMAVSAYCTELGILGVTPSHVRDHPALVISEIRQFMEQK